jgi:hypothetical protein
MQVHAAQAPRPPRRARRHKDPTTPAHRHSSLAPRGGPAHGAAPRRPHRLAVDAPGKPLGASARHARSRCARTPHGPGRRPSCARRPPRSAARHGLAPLGDHGPPFRGCMPAIRPLPPPPQRLTRATERSSRCEWVQGGYYTAKGQRGAAGRDDTALRGTRCGQGRRARAGAASRRVRALAQQLFPLARQLLFELVLLHALHLPARQWRRREEGRAEGQGRGRAGSAARGVWGAGCLGAQHASATAPGSVAARLWRAAHGGARGGPVEPPQGPAGGRPRARRRAHCSGKRQGRHRGAAPATRRGLQAAPASPSAAQGCPGACAARRRAAPRRAAPRRAALLLQGAASACARAPRPRHGPARPRLTARCSRRRNGPSCPR